MESGIPSQLVWASLSFEVDEIDRLCRTHGPWNWDKVCWYSSADLRFQEILIGLPAEEFSKQKK
eukprot:1191357-Rhodomonas_salina.1